MEKKVDQIIIKLVQGDITELDTEAIVNAANNRGWMGGGVAGAIKRKGGKEIEDEAVKKGTIPIGEAAVTGAGRLKAKYIIHAATMGMDFATDETRIRNATRNSLLRAEELCLASLAFPALGAGVGGFPLDQVAKIMMEEVRKHATQSTSIKEVVFVAYDEAAYCAFKGELIRCSK